VAVATSDAGLDIERFLVLSKRLFLLNHLLKHVANVHERRGDVQAVAPDHPDSNLGLSDIIPAPPRTCLVTYAREGRRHI
jgi:hypothetical protein